MKHISSKLIVLTILTVCSLLTLTAYFSVHILQKEIRAYTFQNQQLQTQVLAKNFEMKVLSMQDVAARVFSIRADQHTLPTELQKVFEDTSRGNPMVRGVGIYLKVPALGWFEAPQGALIPALSNSADLLSKVNETYIFADPKMDDQVVLFPTVTAVIAVRMNLTQLKDQCSGLPVGVFNSAGIPMLFCDPAAGDWMKASTDAVKTALQSNFQSGSFERGEPNRTGLWGYSDLSNWGKVISVVDTAVVYRPAYLLAIRITLIVLMSIGIAIIISIWMAQKLTSPITTVSNATQRIANGEFDTTIYVDTQDETQVLAQSVQTMAQNLKRLFEAEHEKAKLDAQLEVAGTVAKTLIPDPLVEFGDLRISSYYKPADQCGGDWWAFLRGKNKVGVFIGDVTGHGYPSALLVATTRGFTSMLQDHVDRVGEIDLSPGDMLGILNRVVYDATRGELNMTAMCVVLDLSTNKFVISSAGHNAAYQLNPNSEKITSVNAKGVRLGEAATLPKALKESEGAFESIHDKLVLFTDGIMDVGTGENLLGKKGFMNFLKEKIKFSGPDIVHAVDSELVPMNQGTPLLDDITFVVIEYKSGSPAVANQEPPRSAASEPIAASAIASEPPAAPVVPASDPEVSA